MCITSNILRRLNLTEKKEKIVRNLFWATLSKFVSLVGSFVVGIFVARYLGKEQYGLMNYIISFVMLFQVVAYFGLDNIQIREEAKMPEERDKIVGTTFFLRIGLAVVTYLVLIVWVCLLEKDSFTRTLIILYGFAIIIETFTVIRNHFTSIVWNEYVAKTEIGRTLIGAVLKVVLMLCHVSLIWFVIALVFDFVLLASGYVLSYSKKIDTMRKWRYDNQLAKFLLRQSFPLFLSGAAFVFYNRIDQVMVDRMIDHQHLGLYAVAVRFMELLTIVPTIIAQTVTPLLVDIRRSDVERYESMSRLFMNVTVAVCVLLALFVSMLSYPIVYCTFGQAYIGATSVLAILSFKVIGDALSQTSGQLIIIENLQKYAPIRNIIGCVTCIALNYLLISHYGIHGAAYAAVITMFVSGTLANFVIPAYSQIFHKQIYALCFGWRDVTNIKQLVR
ncbi:MAG: flippase [Prevotellaceae bacterium]|nr:flippase [Prevotellaceae bacterium]